MAFGYVVSGVVIYGFMGWLLDRWLGTSFLVAIGILLGTGLALFQTFARFGLKSNVEGEAPAQEQPLHDGTQEPDK